MGSQRKLPAKRIPRHTVEWEGEKHKLAILSKSGPLSNVEKIKIANVVCKMYATNQYTIHSCLKHCGIMSEGTWHRWTRSVKEIEELYLEAKEERTKIYKEDLVDRARSMAQKLIEGYTVEIKEQYAEVVANPDSPDEQIAIPRAVRKKEVFVKPNIQAIKMVLYNMDSGNFQSNPDPVERMNEDVDIPPILWVGED